MIDNIVTISVKNTTQLIHWHDLLEIDFVLRGEADVTINNRIEHVKAGELLVCNRDDTHRIESDSEDLLYVQLLMDLKRFNQYIPEIWTTLFKCSPDENDAVSKSLKAEIKDHIVRILRAADHENKDLESKRIILYHCVEILSCLKMGFLVFKDKEIRKLSEENLERLWKAVDYMYDNCTRKLSLHEVAQQVFISDSYLTKILKQGIGRSFEDFLGFVRSEISIRLLLNTELSISNIAYECGFSAPKYYTASFQKIYQCTPKEYRERNKELFLFEKQKQTSIVAFEENVDKSIVFDLIQKYEMFYAPGIVTQNIEIELSDHKKIEDNMHAVRELLRSLDPVNMRLYKNEFYKISRYCCIAQNDVFVYREAGAIVIFIYNADPELSKVYNMKLTGLNPNKRYVYSAEYSLDISDEMKELIENDQLTYLNRYTQECFMKTSAEVDTIMPGDSYDTSTVLRSRQFVRFVIQEIDWK